MLLDVDGTLVDSNDAHALAFAEAFAAHDYDVSFEVIRPLIGMGSDKLLHACARLHKDTRPGKEIAERKAELFKEKYLPVLRPFPRVRELLQRMRQDGLRLVTASSAQADELEALLEIAGVMDLLDDVTSASEVDRSKPDPDVIHAALEKIGLSPSDVLLLGDTPYDVEAGQRAEVGSIALRCGGWSEAELAGALAIYADPADLLAQYDRSPLHR
jgi:HAD superfamily hydrolase (TIGR01509 family)